MFRGPGTVIRDPLGDSHGLSALMIELTVGSRIPDPGSRIPDHGSRTKRPLPIDFDERSVVRIGCNRPHRSFERNLAFGVLVVEDDENVLGRA